MISKRIISWLIRKLINSQEFNSFLHEKIHTFYENESLKIARVWGDKEKIILGQHVQMNNVLINTVSGSVVIGDYTFFGHSVSILTGTHNINKFDLDRQTNVPDEGRDIIIGKGVWIASNAVIVGPCEIGDYSVIGVNSYVTGKLDSYSFYAGAPAKKIKTIDRDFNERK